jgi:hypothetical protein
METKFKNYAEYILSQKDIINKNLDAIVNATSKNQVAWGPTGILNGLADVLTLFVSTDVKDRRDQVIALGFDPKRSSNIDFNGSQGGVAYKIVEHIKSEDLDTIKIFAKNLKESFKFD